MSSLVVVSYPHEYQAEEVRLRLLRMQKEYLVDLEDAAIAVRKENGKIKLRQLYSLTGAGAVSGGFWACWWASSSSTLCWARPWGPGQARFPALWPTWA
jgi:uncharacterized membrane protein